MLLKHQSRVSKWNKLAKLFSTNELLENTICITGIMNILQEEDWVYLNFKSLDANYVNAEK